MTGPLSYHPNPAHKKETTEAGPPRWNPSKEICPSDMSIQEREKLLKGSESRDGSPNDPHRFAIRRIGKTIELYETRLTLQRPDGVTEVHGHPTEQIPPIVLRRMRDNGLITSAEYKQLIRSLG